MSTRMMVRRSTWVAVPHQPCRAGCGLSLRVSQEGKAELRNLEVGPIEDGWAVIERGLSPGERIVTSGQYRVEPGAPVEILTDQDQSAVANTVDRP